MRIRRGRGAQQKSSFCTAQQTSEPGGGGSSAASFRGGLGGISCSAARDRRRQRHVQGSSIGPRLFKWEAGLEGTALLSVLRVDQSPISPILLSKLRVLVSVKEAPFDLKSECGSPPNFQTQADTPPRDWVGGVKGVVVEDGLHGRDPLRGRVHHQRQEPRSGGGLREDHRRDKGI
jgi:hypothetical protein